MKYSFSREYSDIAILRGRYEFSTAYHPGKEDWNKADGSSREDAFQHGRNR